VRRGDGNGGMSRTRYRAGVRFGFGRARRAALVVVEGVGRSRLVGVHRQPRDRPQRQGVRCTRVTQRGRVASGASHSSEITRTSPRRLRRRSMGGSSTRGTASPAGSVTACRWQGFAVVLGRFSMGRHPRPHNADEPTPANRHLAKVDWIDDLPPDGHAWPFTVLVTDAGVALAGPPGARTMQAKPVGKACAVSAAEAGEVRATRVVVRLNATGV